MGSRVKQFAWEDEKSGKEKRRGRSSSSSSSSRKPTTRYSPPGRRNGSQRSPSRQNRGRYRSRSRRRCSRSRSRGRGRSRSRSRGGGGKGAARQGLLCLNFVRNKCQKGDRCTFDHPEKEECRRRLEVIAQQPCKQGSRCNHPDCLFTHPGEQPRRRPRDVCPSSGSSSRSRSRSRPKPTMKAVGWKSFEGIQVPEDLRLPKIFVDPRSKDILVRLHSTDMNPVSFKKNEGGTEVVSYGSAGHGTNRILAYSSAGVVEELSEAARASGKFKVGDAVWFANVCEPANDFIQEYRLVDYRVTSLKPRALSFADAASIPFAALSAWGGMIRHMQMDIDLFGGGVRLPRFTSDNKAVFLAVPGGCAASSCALQFARRYLNRNNNLTVVASATRAESVEWCKKMGAEHVIKHDVFDLKEELRRVGIKGLDYVFCGTLPAQQEENLYAVMNVLGKMTSVQGANFERADSCLPERITLYRERMGLKDKFLEADGEVLETVARLFDDSTLGLESLVTEKFTGLTAEAMRKAYTWHSLKSGDRDAMGNAVFDFE